MISSGVKTDGIHLLSDIHDYGDNIRHKKPSCLMVDKTNSEI